MTGTAHHDAAAAVIGAQHGTPLARVFSGTITWQSGFAVLHHTPAPHLKRRDRDGDGGASRCLPLRGITSG